MSNSCFESKLNPAVSVSAIVVSYFTGPLLSRAVASLRQQPGIDSVILVDNGNFAGDVENAVAGDDGAPVSILSGHGNIGFAAACNLGARAATGAILLFINPGAVMPEKGLQRMLRDL